MFAVLFEVHPKGDQWDAYLGYAKMLKPELERIDGFVDNIRYRSLSRDGWILSLSSWRDEKALVRWRTRRKIYLWYAALRDLDRKLVTGLEGPAIDAEIARLRDIQQHVSFVEVPLSYMEEFYHLRLHLRMLQEILEKKSQK